MSPQQIYSLHVPLALALLVLTVLFTAVESVKGTWQDKGGRRR